MRSANRKNLKDRFVRKLFIAVLALGSACTPQLQSAVGPPREELIATLDEVSALEQSATDSNRCEINAKIDKKLREVCTECIDGWGLTSYSSQQCNGTGDSHAESAGCFQDPEWIAIKHSYCGHCGLAYYKSTGMNLEEGKSFEDLIEVITCDEFYALLARKEKNCGSCIVKKRSN